MELFLRALRVWMSLLSNLITVALFLAARTLVIVSLSPITECFNKFPSPSNLIPGRTYFFPSVSKIEAFSPSLCLIMSPLMTKVSMNCSRVATL